MPRSQPRIIKGAQIFALILAAVSASSCGGSDSDTGTGNSGSTGSGTAPSPPPTPPPSPPSTYTVGGSISGLTGTGLVLEDNGGDNLAVAGATTSFKFATALAAGAPYAVSVAAQPSNPAQTCTVSAGSGSVGSANVTNVAVACTTTDYSVGGTIQGLTASGLVLLNNGTDSLTLSAGSSTFTFATPLAPQAAYNITVSTQPSSPREYCSVSSPTGTVSSGNVTSVAVSCHPFGQFLYVVNSTDNVNAAGDVAAFSISSTDGTLTAIGSPTVADASPAAVTVDPTGNFIYVANHRSADVTVFSVDPTAGGLTLNHQVATTGVANNSIAISPQGQYLFAAGINNTGASSIFDFSVGTDSGVLTVDPAAPFYTSNIPFGLAVDPSDSFLFVTAQQKHALHSFAIGSITAPGGLLTETANSPDSNLPSQPYAVAVAPASNAGGGILFVTDAGINKVSILSYDSGGNLQELTGRPWYSPVASGAQPEGLALDTTGTCLYVANYSDGTVSSFAVAVNGVLTGVQTGNSAVSSGNLTNVANPGPVDVKVDPSAPYVYVVNSLDGSVSQFATTGGAGTTPCTLTLGQTYPTASGATPVALAID